MKSTVVHRRQLLQALERMAPRSLAEGWDNTGMIVDPPHPRPIRRILLTIDVTRAVVREARRRKSDFIISYHPPLFDSLDRLSRASGRGRALLALVAARLPVYSPHTALDNAPGGVNDWLADGVGPGLRRPIHPRPRQPDCGSGRLIRLKAPVSIRPLIRRLEDHLGTRLAARVPGATRRIRTVAVCAGAGASVVRETAADAWVTGEMRHHDLLEARERGIAVLLFGHTETERGYLVRLKQRLTRELPSGLRIDIARSDRPPLS